MTEELWMNTPMGYPFAEKIAKSDIGRLKSFLIGTTADEQTQQVVREMTDSEVIRTYQDNGFTFDSEWYGARLFDWQRL